MSGAQVTRVHEAEIRWYRAAPGTDDASDMYVMEVLGVTAQVRRRTIKDAEPGDRQTDTYIHIETTEGAVIEVNNGGENDYGYG